MNCHVQKQRSYMVLDQPLTVFSQHNLEWRKCCYVPEALSQKEQRGEKKTKSSVETETRGHRQKKGSVQTCTAKIKQHTIRWLSQMQAVMGNRRGSGPGSDMQRRACLLTTCRYGAPHPWLVYTMFNWRMCTTPPAARRVVNPACLPSGWFYLVDWEHFYFCISTVIFGLENWLLINSLVPHYLAIWPSIY